MNLHKIQIQEELLILHWVILESNRHFINPGTFQETVVSQIEKVLSGEIGFHLATKRDCPKGGRERGRVC